MPNGQGLRINPDGSKYSGMFNDGQKHGKGTYTWLENGKVNRYVGDFR